MVSFYKWQACGQDTLTTTRCDDQWTPAIRNEAISYYGLPLLLLQYDFSRTDSPVLTEYPVRRPGIKSAPSATLIGCSWPWLQWTKIYILIRQFASRINTLIISARAHYTGDRQSCMVSRLEYARGQAGLTGYWSRKQKKADSFIIQFVATASRKNGVMFDASRSLLWQLMREPIAELQYCPDAAWSGQGIAAMSGELLEEVKPQITASKNWKNWVSIHTAPMTEPCHFTIQKAHWQLLQSGYPSGIQTVPESRTWKSTLKCYMIWSIGWNKINRYSPSFHFNEL